MDKKKTISSMSLRDRIAYCTGADMWHTKAMSRYGIPSLKMSDGPHGLRCQSGEGDNLGIHASLPSTCFPTGVSAADSWDTELLFKEGEAIAEEALEYGVNVVLGPAVNIKRDPRGGRSFEYYSEDPHLAGKLASSYIQGVQSRNVGVSLKHFACNNQEYKRSNGNSIVDERALREIYLKPFEIAVKEASPASLMCSYNRINGIHASDHRYLLTDILRKEWGFEGAVITDWGAMSDRIRAFQAGCDLNMPGGADYMEEAVLAAVKNGALAEADIDRCAERILKLTEQYPSHPGFRFDRKKHHQLARQIACESAVLLKNDGILPLKRSDIGITGYFAKELRYQGAGSSHINPTELHSVTELCPEIPYVSATDRSGNLIELSRAVKLAKRVKTMVVFAGLPDNYESEGYDRKTIALPMGYNTLIREIAKVNENVVVVLLGGAVMELPWADQVKAILYMGLPGQAGSEAILDLLEGNANPSGKLSETWPMVQEDVITSETFGTKNPCYRESIYVGYRYYDKAKIPVRFPFGHGLSYTAFHYSDPVLNGNILETAVTNTGSRSGKEVVQLYVCNGAEGFRAAKELKDFRKIHLEPGETKTVRFEVRDDFFTVWQDGGFRVIAGEYRLAVGSGSADLRGSVPYTVKGDCIKEPMRGTWYEHPLGAPSQQDFEALLGHPVPEEKEPVRGEYTMDNSCYEMMKDSLVMRLQYLFTKAYISKPFKKEERTMDNPAYHLILTAATDCPMRSLVINSNGVMSESLAEGLLEMANGHYLKGIRKMIRR